MSYFPEPYTSSKNEIKFELDLSIYATKSDLKSAKDVDISNIAKNSDVVCLKSDIDKQDIDKLETTPVNLNKLSNIVKIELVKKTVYDELVKKVNTIQTTNTSNFVKKPTMIQILVKSKRKHLIIIIITSILATPELNNSTS